MGIELYNHNKVAYEKAKEMLKEKDKACIVQATGTGKSFIALKLIEDYLTENKNNKILYLAPLNGIKDQILKHIDGFDLAEDTFDNLKLDNYQAVSTKTQEELKNMHFDYLFLDEFHHVGAPEWTKKLQMLIEANPNVKIFGMSATAIRALGTKHENDVSETFFEGNVASRYDLAQAISDGVLPQPNYHAALIVLEDKCAEIEKKINNGKASPEEKEKYREILTSIRTRISKGETIEEIIQNNIKKDGKYIYFCPKGNDDVIEELQRNIINMLPKEYLENIEIYQVHSKNQTVSENNLNSNNFYHNITLDGKSAKGKLRIMFAIDMYNEGIHVPDIDGVIMGRQTKSDIIFYQQLGRALAVKKKSDGSNEKVEPPLVIDLMCNLQEIKKLYLKVKKLQKKGENSITKEDKEEQNSKVKDGEIVDIPDKPDIPNGPKDIYGDIITFGIDEEIINLLSELEDLNSQVNYSIDFDEKLKELYDYVQENGMLPNIDDKNTKFSDGIMMGAFLHNHKLQIQEKADGGDQMAQEICKYFRLGFDEKLKELYDYGQENGSLPTTNDRNTKFSDGIVMGYFFGRSKSQIQEKADNGDKMAQEICKYFRLGFDEKIKELYDYVQENGSLPNTDDKNTKFSDGKLMGAFWCSNKTQIQEQADNGDKMAQEICKYFKLGFDEKIKELYGYVRENGSLPKRGDKNIKFSDDRQMGEWVIRNRKKIFEQINISPIAGELAKIMLAENPNCFDKVKEFKEAEEEFSEESEFKKARNKKGGKKANGKGK